MTDDLVLTGIDFDYGRRTVLADANLRARPGEVLGLLGPNGCGKSTLLKIGCGVLRAKAGTVELGATDLARLSARQRARLVAYVPQGTESVYELSVRESVMLGRTPFFGMRPGPRDHEVVDEALTALELQPLAQRSVDRLSGGQRQRVLVARALAQQPRLMLLDEPTSALDLAAQVQTMRQLRRVVTADRIVAVVAIHDLNLAARYCDRLAAMHHGRIIGFGTPGEVLTAELIEDVYGLPVEVTEHRGIPEVRPAPDSPTRAGQRVPVWGSPGD